MHQHTYSTRQIVFLYCRQSVFQGSLDQFIGIGCEVLIACGDDVHERTRFEPTGRLDCLIETYS